MLSIPKGNSHHKKEITLTGRKFLSQEGHILGLMRKFLIENSYIRMSKITAISQEILTIPAAPAGSPEENNTLDSCLFFGRILMHNISLFLNSPNGCS